MEIPEEQRENWGTRGGFVLAAVGSAVGLGNLWGFPYKLYSYGGGAFLIPYILAMFCIGIPMLILEFSLGHMTQRAAPDAFGRANKRLEFVGWWGIILGFVIVTYYPVILAYCFSFIYYSIESIVTGKSLPWAGEGIQGVENAKIFFNETYLGLKEGVETGQIRTNILIPLVIAWIAMYFCIFKGVKLVGKIVWLTVPLPFIMLIVLTIRGLTLEGSMKGLVYYLDPVWSELSKPTTWRFAFGQVFFSLSLAFGVMVTYASFLHRKSDINNNAAIIGISDFATSFVAGIAIFATLGGMSYATMQAGNSVEVKDVVAGGPGLTFVAFPYALAQLPAAAWWSLVFFFTLVTLGIDSAFSITESVLAGIVDKTGWKRCIVLPVMSLVGLVFGLIYVTEGGLNWLGTIDAFINGTWGIAFLGLLECVVLGWLYRLDTLRHHANERSDWHSGRWWNFAIRIFIPIVLGTLFLWSLFDDVTNAEGFIKTPSGEWIVPNCVGLIVVGISPIIAILMSLIKSPLRTGQGKQAEFKYPTHAEAGGIGTTSFLLSVIGLLLVIWVLYFGKENLVLIPLFFGIAGIVISYYVLEKHDVGDEKPSLLSRWAGIISTLDISVAISIILIGMTNKINEKEIVYRTADKLSGVSYVILGVVVLIIVGGLGWCFYRAITLASKDQEPEAVDDDLQID
ncbi:MAG: sodium-dependent transporter [Sedimentisphaerales bacterium]|nr:sodium-dependent transporter [Sedimentisphaerales bacterium]